MEKDRQYQQQAFDLTALHEQDDSPSEVPTPTAPSQPEKPRTQFHTLRPSKTRLPNDFWAEYRLEVEFREEHSLPHVSLEEFQDMRDWSDRMPPQDGAWSALPYTIYERTKDR